MIALLAVATLISAAAMFLLYLSIGGEPSLARGSTLVLRPAGSLPEVLPEVAFGGSDELTVRAYVELIRKAKADKRITGILLKPGSLDSPFWAKVQELRAALVDFKSSGKPVHALLEYGGDREYYLASAADHLYLVPSANVDLTGIASYEVFLRGTFDWIGTYPDFLHVGDYKTAINSYLEKSYTPTHREMSESLTRNQYDQLVAGIADGRRKREEEVRALIDRGPFPPEAALSAGLVDDLAYDDELDDFDRGLSSDHFVEAGDYAAVSWSSAGVSRRSTIAIINAAGVITSGRSGYDPVNGPLVGSDSIVEAIREVRANRSVKAIVLRVDSPGGSSVASDVIWRELLITRSSTRPLIVSMSDLAASGGYYISLAGDVIVAQPGTLTGSIGVYTGKFVTGGTFEKLGANIEATSKGRHAEIYSPDRRFTPEERAAVQASMQAVYDEFVERAADSRHMTPEKIDEVAQGRVWTGQQAKAIGLVDQLGGLYTAIDVAKQRARIPAEEEVNLIVYPRRRSMFELLSEGLQSPVGRLQHSTSAEAFVALLGSRERQALAALVAPARIFKSGQILAHMPYVFVR